MIRRSAAISVALLSVALLLGSGLLGIFSPPAWAGPSFGARFAGPCSTCHSSWPALNSTGLSFKLSGYRRLNGIDVKPTTKDIELAMGALSIPSIPPVALTASTGFDFENIQRRAADGTRASQTGNSFDLDSAN